MKHYIFLPSNYIENLQSNKKRAKARAFMEYYFDFQNNSLNSLTFYAKSWDMSLGTVHSWVKEFAVEIEKFHTYWLLKNEQESTSVLKQNENKMKIEKQKNESKNTNQSTNKSTVVKTHLKDENFQNESKMKQDSNSINNNNNAFLDKDFFRFISEIKLVIKNVGNINDIYASYLNVKNLIELPTLSKIYREYAKETAKEKKVGLSKFIEDMMFMSYCKPYIEVQTDGNVIDGCYDLEKEQLITKEKNFGLSVDRYSELNAQGKIKILKYVA